MIIPPIARLPVTLRVGVGAIVGVIAGILAVVLGFGTLIGVLPLVIVVAVGLSMGWLPATSAYLFAIATAVIAQAVVGSVTITPAGAVRLAISVIGAPLLIVLIRRVETALGDARSARAALEEAHAETARRETALTAAQAELADAYAIAERERARLTEVADSVPEPVIVYDADGHGRFGNRAARAAFGRAFIECPPEQWHRLVEPRDERGDAIDPGNVPQLIAQREPVRGRYLVRLPTSGRDFLLDVEGTPVPGGGCVLLLRDVGREEDERRRLSRFASYVAHELRNPLAVAKARIELGMRDPELAQRTRNHGDRALDSIEAAIRILERLELYSRADSGRVEADRSPFNLGAAVETAVERLRARGGDRELRIAVPAGTIVAGDRQLAEQAITNLLTNADRYSSAGLPIAIEATPGDPVVLRVIDGGPGVDDEVAEKLFRDRVTAGRGLGLGLYLVRATMDAQGGSVELERRRPEAIFALRWPAAAPDDGSPAAD